MEIEDQDIEDNKEESDGKSDNRGLRGTELVKNLFRTSCQIT